MRLWVRMRWLSANNILSSAVMKDAYSEVLREIRIFLKLHVMIWLSLRKVQIII
jgi:hypothetical protein